MDTSLMEQKLDEKENRLSPQQQSSLEMRVNAESKSEIGLWIGWLFLGTFGFQRFMLNRPHAKLMLWLEIIAIICDCTIIGVVIGIPISGVLGIWAIIDAFRIPSWYRESQLKVKAKLLDSMN